MDASGIALRNILAQPYGRLDFLVYYARRRFSKAEQRYTITEQKALGMIFAVQKFRHYLLGNLFHFYVDHQALIYLINKVVVQGRLMQWMLLLQEFDFKIFHKPGKENLGANFLSRSTTKEQKKSMQDMPADAELFVVTTVQEMHEDSHDWEPELMEIRMYLVTSEVPERARTSERKAFVIKMVQFTMIAGELYRMGTNRVPRRYMPMSARYLVISESHAGDVGWHFAIDITARKVLAAGMWWTSLHEDVKMYYKLCDLCQRTGRPTAIDMAPITNITPLNHT